MERLKRRADFKAVAGGKRVQRPAFMMQALKAGNEAGDRPSRIGFTVTRQVGNAVLRNRIRRRLRAAVAEAEAGHAEPATDYVLVARRAASTLQFGRLVTDLRSGFAALARQEAPTRSGR